MPWRQRFAASPPARRGSLRGALKLPAMHSGLHWPRTGELQLVNIHCRMRPTRCHVLPSSRQWLTAHLIYSPTYTGPMVNPPASGWWAVRWSRARSCQPRTWDKVTQWAPLFSHTLESLEGATAAVSGAQLITMRDNVTLVARPERFGALYRAAEDAPHPWPLHPALQVRH
jgi:hypothetical protein